MHRYKFIFVGLLSALLMGACSDSGTETVTNDTGAMLVASTATPKKGTDPIAEVARQNGLDELLAAMAYVDDELGAGLVALFEEGNNQHTVFAPTDEAFEDLYTLLSSIVGLPIANVRDIEPQIVLDLLQYMIVPGRRASNSVVPKTNIKRITPMLGEPFFVLADRTIQDGLTGSGLRPGAPAIVTTDILASNGIVHVITEVVVSPKIAEALMGDEPSDELAAIISAFCIDTAAASAEGFQELSEATLDLADCFNEFEDCLGGAFGSGPIECLEDFGECINLGNNDQEQACSEFLNELGRAYRDAIGSASALGLEDEFLDWFRSPDSAPCLAAPLATAALCAGLASN
jgi:uncharacterized surface protein with fasciclin (FAS1) repeats